MIFFVIKYISQVGGLFGEVSEWFKELVLKTSDSERNRGFESHPLRQHLILNLLPFAEVLKW